MRNLFSKDHIRIMLMLVLALVIGWQLGHKDIQFNLSRQLLNAKIENKEVPKNINKELNTSIAYLLTSFSKILSDITINVPNNNTNIKVTITIILFLEYLLLYFSKSSNNFITFYTI